MKKLKIIKNSWRIIPGFPNYYINKDGLIKNISPNSKCTYKRKDKILSPVLQGGYLIVSLYLNSKKSRKPIHHLVATTFIGPRPHKLVINHKDGNKLNNNVNNLEYISNSDNLKHAHKLGLYSYKKGIENPMSKLTEQQVKYILLLSNKISPSKISYMLNITKGCINDILSNRTWKHINRIYYYNNPII